MVVASRIVDHVRGQSRNIRPVKIAHTQSLCYRRYSSITIHWPLRSNIPAVKIADAPALPLFPQSEDSIDNLTSPEACLSGGTVTRTKSSHHRSPVTGTTVTLDPIDSSLFPVKQDEGLPALLTDEENEDEFGEFLLDAVQWL